MNYINLDGIGEIISKLRKEQGITIRELSEYTGYSVGFLSNLETGKNSPTVESLQRVAEALQTDIIEILTKEKQHHTVIRKNERSVFDHPRYKMTIETLDFGYDKQIYEFITIHPGAEEKGIVSRHLFPEVCTVIEGVLTIDVEDSVYTLEEGDSIYIPEKSAHRIYNLGDKRVVTYWVFQKTK